ncbi:MAG: hypothetical protein N838_23155 [Thiohalocapsa sp. PB-PSB1]|jgi:hypothetical protein|nr:MAG: hypothetical protein N838_23155 [Thiohalocapsa sp. PB-PSB1]
MRKLQEIVHNFKTYLSSLLARRRRKKQEKKDDPFIYPHY